MRKRIAGNLLAFLNGGMNAMIVLVLTEEEDAVVVVQAPVDEAEDK